MMGLFSPTDLFCCEEASDCLWAEEREEVTLHLCSDQDRDVLALVERELLHMPQVPVYLDKYRTELLDAGCRQEAIGWLFKAQSMHSFSPLTACLSVNYLDRFLSLHDLPINGNAWMMQLLSVACLSLAAKMEEVDVPLLLDLQVGAAYIFKPRTVQRMELLVMNTLAWRMNSVTPFSYTDCFIHSLNISSDCRRALGSTVEDMILCAIQELEFLEFRPSAIAMAATLCGTRELLADSFGTYKETMLSILPLQLQTSAEKCFHLMVRRRQHRHENSSVPQSPAGVLDASFTSGDSNDEDPSAITTTLISGSKPSDDASQISGSAPPSKKSKLRHSNAEPPGPAFSSIL